MLAGRRAILGNTSLTLVALSAMVVIGHVPAGATEPSFRARPDSATATVPVEESAAAIARWKDEEGSAATTQVINPLIASRIDHLRGASPSFEQAWRDIASAGIPVVIGTKDEIGEILPGHIQKSTAWAAITVTWGSRFRGRLERSAIAIRVDWLRTLHERLGSPHEAFVDALDGLIVHEVYGHLAAAVESGDAGELCADPKAGQRHAESCVGKREAIVHAELNAAPVLQLADDWFLCR